MANKIASAKNYTTILDAVYQCEAVSNVLNSPARLMRAGKSTKEIMIPKICCLLLSRNLPYGMAGCGAMASFYRFF